MAYTITAQVFQTNPNTFFRVVEKTTFKSTDGGNAWGESNGTHVLTMDASGTSGSLRFLSDSGENFIITLGVHNFKRQAFPAYSLIVLINSCWHALNRWGDIVTNLTNGETGVIITPQYYGSEHPDRVAVREAQLVSYSVENAKGRTFAFNFVVAEGNDLKVNIVIG
ncbi:hypothetical protein NLI96_g6754 [Meripilus lineatus]|uniref:Lectin n=1 Tax=Meripilus lineatus TaxID=2056292 RepID=A0AAD5V0F7_9APHY|nr:hypothetical protein NLI96_g6754 [Physisporinus lineatus]